VEETVPARIRRSAARIAVLCGVMIALLAALAGLAAAAPAQTGWVRLAHFSPDTPAVDVRLSAFDGAQMLALPDVNYGAISAYQQVVAGTYTATMLPPGATPGSTPVVTQAVKVEAGKAYTVAAVGRNADLHGAVLADDLTPPARGEARIRLIQAAASAPEVTVRAEGGPVIAEAARFGTATGYAQITPGVWTVDLGATGVAATRTTVTVPRDSVTTLTVLDRDGRLALEPTVDASGVGAVPRGGVETGGGGTAGDGSPVNGPIVLVVAAFATVLAAGLRRRHRAR
jgi:Domain of unknown function (DUF4397)